MARNIFFARDGWFGLKRAIKYIVIYVPFYNHFLRILHVFLPDKSWVTRIPIAPTEVPVFVDDIELVMVKPERCEIAKTLWWTNGVRSPKEDQVALELFKYYAEDADMVFDIGCNSGLFALVAARANANAKVVAFDILPEAIQLCFANVVRNNLARIKILLCGIGKPGTYFRAPKNMISSSVPSSISTDLYFKEGVDVPIVSLDSLEMYLDEKAKVLIKIDVEGTEDSIFRYGGEFLRKYKPIIICEILRRANVNSFEQQLKDLGYRFELITAAGTEPRETLSPDPKLKDWLFIPHK